MARRQGAAPCALGFGGPVALLVPDANWYWKEELNLPANDL